MTVWQFVVGIVLYALCCVVVELIRYAWRRRKRLQGLADAARQQVPWWLERRHRYDRDGRRR